MLRLMPPPPTAPPMVALADDDRLRRLSQRIRMVGLSLGTILGTTWFFTLGVVPGVLAAMVAKHILVAILTMGLGVDKDSRG